MDDVVVPWVYDFLAKHSAFVFVSYEFPFIRVGCLRFGSFLSWDRICEERGTKVQLLPADIMTKR